MASQKPAFDPIEAQYMVNWMRKCVAMERNERSDKGCRYCPEAETGCINGLMERAATQLELAIKNKGASF